ncbi:hypothetical protein [Wenyingzhuangia aestuarii]|uniref:hypothetical protein n=1 Tax=Wenyingzhuangia aestuarii TaxID=1647582 RepID=UPI00143AB24B|nr:hypothetical protein [Wenyingzhuangia aestuarii]NJB82693.1 hypothetical protein [Wenyingzhuangia aestuarii]
MERILYQMAKGSLSAVLRGYLIVFLVFLGFFLKVQLDDHPSEVALFREKIKKEIELQTIKEQKEKEQLIKETLERIKKESQK